MAVSTYVIGNDGNVSIGSVDVLKVRSFAATLQRVSSDLTGFGDSGRRRRLGMIDLTGSMTGVAAVGTTTATTGTSVFYGINEAHTVTLTIYDSTSTSVTTDANIVATCVFDQFAFNSDKTGDTTVTANFANSSGSAPVVTWLT